MLDADLRIDRSGVWILNGHERFGYSDGPASERYLHQVLSNARDRSSGSAELETYIRDWPSEYHLSGKRHRLLSGFAFDANSRVLEVGCGCGAITRYLGERFQQVVAVEGSVSRARLARLRTQDMQNVDIVCAPFQSLRVKQQFDLIFCIGVLEYSGSFVDGPSPVDDVLSVFAEWLHPEGALVVAIENQFGLKYFNGFREDHLGIKYEGLEGYHGSRNGPRTFGSGELRRKLGRRFRTVDFFYPFPDYKLPACVVDHDFLEGPWAAELVAQSASRDYHSPAVPLWDEQLVTFELARNGMLPFFANSFVVIASKGDGGPQVFPQAAVFHSADRSPRFRTVTRVLRDSANRFVATKTLASGAPTAASGPLKLRAVTSPWEIGKSLEATLLERCRRRGLALEEIFEPCRLWADALREHCVGPADDCMLPGRFVDATWSNSFIDDQRVRFVDQEWEWDQEIGFGALMIRVIYVFLCRVEGKKGRRLNQVLYSRRGRALITRIAKSVGVALFSRDFERFVVLQAEIHSRVWGASRWRSRLLLQWYLVDRQSMKWAMRMRDRVARAVIRIAASGRQVLSTTAT